MKPSDKITLQKLVQKGTPAKIIAERLECSVQTVYDQTYATGLEPPGYYK